MYVCCQSAVVSGLPVCFMSVGSTVVPQAIVSPLLCYKEAYLLGGTLVTVATAVCNNISDI